MVTLVAFLALAQTTPPPAQGTDVGKLMGDMIAKYYGAKSIVGTIKAYVPNVKASVDTTIQFERPNKLYLKQARNGSEPKTTLVMCDGVMFSYDRPEYVLGASGRFVEPVNPGGGRTALEVKDIYKASVDSLLDRSTPLDILIGHPDDLRYNRSQWMSGVDGGKTTINNREATIIKGDWRQNGGVKKSGTYEMYITADHDLVRFVMTQWLAHPDASPSKPLQPIEVRTVWDVDVKVNAAPDQSLFGSK